MSPEALLGNAIHKTLQAPHLGATGAFYSDVESGCGHNPAGGRAMTL
jgi:hypothetical protein